MSDQQPEMNWEQVLNEAVKKAREQQAGGLFPGRMTHEEGIEGVRSGMMPNLWHTLVDASRDDLENLSGESREKMEFSLRQMLESSSRIVPPFGDVAATIHLLAKIDEFRELVMGEDIDEKEQGEKVDGIVLQVMSMIWSAGYCYGIIERHRSDEQVNVAAQGADGTVALAFNGSRIRETLGDDVWEAMMEGARRHRHKESEEDIGD